MTNETKKIQKQAEKEAKKLVKDELSLIPKSPAPPKTPIKRIRNRPSRTDKKPTKRAKKSQADIIRSKAKRLIKTMKATYYDLGNHGFKLSPEAEKEYQSLISSDIHTKQQLEKLRKFTPANIRRQAHYEITKIRSGLDRDGKPISNPITSSLTYQQMTTPTGRAAAVNKALSFKLPSDHEKKKIHITSRWETSLLRAIVISLGYKLEEGKAYDNEYFTIKAGWKLNQLAHYIHFKSLPDTPTIRQKITTLAESAFSQQELYDAYKEQKRKNRALKDLPDALINKLSDTISTNLLLAILWRDVYPSDDIPDVYEYVVEQAGVLHDTNESEFEKLVAMIENQENISEIIKHIQKTTKRIWKSNKRGGFDPNKE